jgi:hypothetical protein
VKAKLFSADKQDYSHLTISSIHHFLDVYFLCRHRKLSTIDSLPKENEPKRNGKNSKIFSILHFQFQKGLAH